MRLVILTFAHALLVPFVLRIIRLLLVLLVLEWTSYSLKRARTDTHAQRYRCDRCDLGIVFQTLFHAIINSFVFHLEATIQPSPLVGATLAACVPVKHTHNGLMAHYE